MKIENQVCTPDQAKRLNELGVAQGLSAFYWETQSAHDETILHYNRHPFGGYKEAQYCFSAYNVAELGEVLPTAYDTMRTTLTPSKFEWLGYDNDGNGCPDGKGYATEAECRAAMLIHLIESSLLSVNEVNERIKQ